MQKTKIEWADYSSNPIKFRYDEAQPPINLCVPISTGCKNCYAAAIGQRFNAKDHGDFAKYGERAMKLCTAEIVESEIKQLLNRKFKGPFKNGRDRPIVFVGDMTDLFGPFVPFEWIDELFAVFTHRYDVDFMLLTKRAERMARYFTTRKKLSDLKIRGFNTLFHGDNPWLYEWPMRNVFLGVSAENQEQADLRIPWLIKTPAHKRFVSFEPLLGSIDLPFTQWEKIDLAIIGGESGKLSRPCFASDIGFLLRQCGQSSAKCFMKQLGSYHVRDNQPHLSSRRVPLQHSKGADMSEWPESWRVREMF